MPHKDPNDRTEYNENYYNEFKDLILSKNRKTMALKERTPKFCKCGGSYIQIGNLKGAKVKHEQTGKHELWSVVEKFIVPNRILLQPNLNRTNIINHMINVYEKAGANILKKRLAAAHKERLDIIKMMDTKGLQVINRNL